MPVVYRSDAMNRTSSRRSLAALRRRRTSCLRAALEPLETRRLLCSAHDELAEARDGHHDDLGTFAVHSDRVLPPPPPTTQHVATAAVAAATNVVPLTAVPVLNSHPGAPASLYLDFVGDDT